MREYRLGIVRWWDAHISNGLLEGLHSLVQAAKRRPRLPLHPSQLHRNIQLTAGELQASPMRRREESAIEMGRTLGRSKSYALLMPTPLPARDRDVYFVGAGLSVAMGLPNTAMLLDGVLDLARRSPRWTNEGLEERLERAFKYFYPEAIHAGYRPDVVDFFSALRTYLDIGAGLPGGFSDAPHLYRSLKSAIAHLLIERLRHCDTTLKAGHPYLDGMVSPGNFIVTSNWDLLIERYAQLHGVPLRHSGSGRPDEVVLLKLHGSIDWCLGQHMASKPSSDYAMLTERLFGSRPYTPSLPATNSRAHMAVRIRAVETWSRALSMIRSRASEPHMVTMAHGKSGDLGPLRALWRDAYGAISRAARLEVIGYSMPPDDVEVRTILRAGVERGADLDQVIVRNPTPEVHDRIRRYLDRNVESDYRGISVT